MLLSCKEARMKCGSYLENKKKRQVVTEKSRKKEVSYWWDCVSEKGKEGLTWLHYFSWHWYNKIQFWNIKEEIIYITY